jgi:UPF0755 protein
LRGITARLLGLAILIASFASGWAILDYRDYLRAPVVASDAKAVVFTVESGDSLKRIARKLHKAGLLRHPVYFRLHARWQGQQGRLKAGEYMIEPGMTPGQLLTLFVSGKVRLLSFTIVEGWTWKRLKQELFASKTLRITLDELDDQEIMRRLGMPGMHPEGRFLPETYRFPRGTTDLEFLKRAANAMKVYLDSEWDKREKEGLPIKSPYQTLILASIVERETAVSHERRQIAGVFIRRLKKGMRLQTDPTVIYGLGDRFDGNLRRSDLTNDTPYNTYTRSGLPPTPIAMPGKDAIHAALHPAPGKSLYFVARGDGTHHFSDTLAEHNRAVIKYQLGGRNRPFSSNPAGSKKKP